MTQTGLSRRGVFLAVFGLSVAFIAYDYFAYHSRYKTAIDVAQAHGARVGSLLDWPFGRECRITFDQPIDRKAVAELTVLNALTVRHSIGIAFNYNVTDNDLQHARETLPKCNVFRLEQVDRRP